MRRINPDPVDKYLRSRSLAELAYKAKMSTNTLSQIRNGRYRCEPKPVTIHMLAKAIGCPEADLIIEVSDTAQ